jgi:undecaprenyl diphosphate synthase
MSELQHVGVIVDGNRRWAKARGLPTLAGHRAGYARVKELARWLFARGVKYASFYLFSRENWKRSGEEVSYLMRLLEDGLRHDVADFVKDSIQLKFAGGREQLSPVLQQLMREAEQATAQGRKGTIFACINYGGQQDIVEAVRRLAGQASDLKKLTLAELKAALTTAELPACDLVIRTSGEQRLSNFLLWETAYAELYFTPVFFPDFTEAELDQALAWFAKRQRRFGS